MRATAKCSVQTATGLNTTTDGIGIPEEVMEAWHQAAAGNEPNKMKPLDKNMAMRKDLVKAALPSWTH